MTPFAPAPIADLYQMGDGQARVRAFSTPKSILAIVALYMAVPGYNKSLSVDILVIQRGQVKVGDMHLGRLATVYR
jgi:hypothetical protein